jgi:hypothetical protein
VTVESPDTTAPADVASSGRPGGDETPEMAISLDMARRGVLVAPALLAVCGLIWGWAGVAGGAYGVAIIVVNFLLAAATITVAARISYGALMGAVLFGFLIRLGLIVAAVLPVRDSSWISLPALGATIIVTHIGLLVWELRHVSISLAVSGLKPATRRSHHH